ncbi:allatostatin C-like [Adelges cooleyi]|uniref:allatostatin C-like n=1 Tax=Adelges cooleyi TaxID=133065 RepID=UPI00218066F9|nr:allatostatin C-like [Adelges cooleyi]
MAKQIEITMIGLLLTVTLLAGCLLKPAFGNAIDQRVLQRELGERPPEVMSIDDKEDYRDLDESNIINDYGMKPKSDYQSLENALAEYLFAKQMASKFRARGSMMGLQKKRSYWKQCAFNAVSCFG